MVQARLARSNKRQLGQFLTPQPLADKIVSSLNIQVYQKVLEPGCGDGSFLVPAIKRFLDLGLKLDDIFTNHIWAVEIDPDMHKKCIDRLKSEFGEFDTHNIVNEDFLISIFDTKFDHIIGNPPFGGTINSDYQDQVDRKFGRRSGMKIKKETYSFFIVKCVDNHLNSHGQLTFISSDTFKTIPTMKGLRKHLMNSGCINVEKIKEFSDETSYPMVLLKFQKSLPCIIFVDNKLVSNWDIEKTPNLSWAPVNPQLFKYTIGDFMTCSSGMTTGKNKYFLRDIFDNDKIIEPYQFEYFDDPITLEKETHKARIGKISDKKKEAIEEMEKSGSCRRNVRVTLSDNPKEIVVPHPNYKPYNKSNSNIIYSKPLCMIYWENDGDAVKTYKKNGNWYLHGVGGLPYFEREGLTWGLVASKMKMRYLPAGYILDSGAPCAFLKRNTHEDELYFILGWCLTDEANYILKTVLNHTQNIQSKDVERLPYPIWCKNKKEAIEYVKTLVQDARYNNIEYTFDHPAIKRLNSLYERNS